GERPTVRTIVMTTIDVARTALERAAAAVDERFGLVHQLVVHEVGPSDPPFFYATAQLAATRGFSDVDAASLNGGAGRDAATAMLAALGEAIERYAIALYHEDHLVRAAFEEL